MSTGVDEWENLDLAKTRRAQHLYVGRCFNSYYHHGIVITLNDIAHITTEFFPKERDIEPLMVIEQTREGLQIVTVSEFQGQATKCSLPPPIHCARYSVPSDIYHSSRRGTCYMEKCLDENTIVWNAIDIFNDPRQHEIWKTYRLLFRNCEQFAFLCCTNTRALGEQISFWGKQTLTCITVPAFGLVLRVAFNVFKKAALNALYLGDRAIQDGLSVAIISFDDIICSCLKGNAIAAGVSFAVEASILTVRLIIYYFWKNDREKNLARKFAITPEEYCRCMTLAGFANLVAFGVAAGGIALIGLTGAALTGGWTVALSILFGFLGYLVGRWISGKIYDKCKGFLSRRYGSVISDIRENLSKTGNIEKLHILQQNINKIELETYGLIHRIRVTIREVQITLDAYRNRELTRREALDDLNDEYESLLLTANKIMNEHGAIAQQLGDNFNDELEECYEQLTRIELTFTSLIEHFDEMFISARKVVITNCSSKSTFSRKAADLYTLIQIFVPLEK